MNPIEQRPFTILAGAFLFGVAVSLSACGSGGGGNAAAPAITSTSNTTLTNNVTVSTNPSLACPGGEYNPFGLGCVPAANFQSACAMPGSQYGYNGGLVTFGQPSQNNNVIVSNPSITTAADGTSVCQSYLYVALPMESSANLVGTFQGNGAFAMGRYAPTIGNQMGNAPGNNMPGSQLLPRITPSSAQSGTNAIALPIYLLAADSLKVLSTGNSGWSATVANSNPATLQNGCAQTPIWGGSAQNEGMPEGLMVSDGTSAYFVGNQQYVRILHYAHPLLAGFNVPAGTTGCYQLLSSAVRVARCLDASGTAHACSNPQ